MDLSSVGGSLLGVVAAPNTYYSSLQFFLLFTGQSSIPPILCHIWFFYIKLSLLKLCGIFVYWLDPDWQLIII